MESRDVISRVTIEEVIFYKPSKSLLKSPLDSPDGR
jgi:hypothetical protein